MIPDNLHWAFEEGHRVATLGGAGRTERRRLADLVLPTGNLLIGYPGDDMVNVPNEEFTPISPGAYPVFITLARHRTRGNCTMAFVSVLFLQSTPVSWERAGSFFTDMGDGALVDAGFRDLLRRKKGEMPLEQWREFKMGALEGGDGNLVLDESTGANAIVFRTGDWQYNCYAGYDGAKQLACLIIDGRTSARHENPIASAIRNLLGR